MRLFAAIYPPGSALDHLAEAVGRLRIGEVAATGTNVRLTGRALWHLTLVFLGEVADDRAADAAAALRAGVAQWQGTPLTLQLAGGGKFGRGRFTVLWAGLTGDTGDLSELSSGVRRSLRRARLPYDHKPFRPHLTFARPGDRLPAADIAADVAVLRDYAGPVWSADRVHLVRSHLGPKPVHERLAEVPFT